MVTITDAALRQNVFEEIYTIASAVTYSSTISGSVITTAAYIDSDKAFPQVVVHPVDVNQSNFVYDRSRSDRDIRVLIDIWTKKNKDKDIIADALSASLVGYAYNGLHLTNIDESNAVELASSNKVHLKSIALTFRR